MLATPSAITLENIIPLQLYQPLGACQKNLLLHILIRWRSTELSMLDNLNCVIISFGLTNIAYCEKFLNLPGQLIINSHLKF